ncbi:Uncharacterised protein [Vibrio cholerae]|nr:Uncharacterised protein [Vibrio cholerae]
MNAKLLSHHTGGAHKHTLEHHAHLTIIDLLEDLSHHRSKIDRDKSHFGR